MTNYGGSFPMTILDDASQNLRNTAQLWGMPTKIIAYQIIAELQRKFWEKEYELRLAIKEVKKNTFFFQLPPLLQMCFKKARQWGSNRPAEGKIGLAGGGGERYKEGAMEWYYW